MASLLNVELSGKGLQLLKEAAPSATRVAVLWNSGNQLHSGIRAATEAAAATLKIRTDMLDVRGPDDLPRAFEAMGRGRPDGLLVLPDSVTLAHRKPILEFAAGRRLPAMYAFIEMVEDGGLMSPWPESGRELPSSRRLRRQDPEGGQARNLPIAQATKFDLVINLRTAKTLGLSIRSRSPSGPTM